LRSAIGANHARVLESWMWLECKIIEQDREEKIYSSIGETQPIMGTMCKQQTRGVGDTK